jgi:general secretion pathway protein D
MKKPSRILPSLFIGFTIFVVPIAWGQTTENLKTLPLVETSETLINLDFKDAKIASVARSMAVLTGHNVVVDPRVRGKMDLYSEVPVTIDKAWALFRSALRLYGATVVSSNGIDRVLPESEAKLQASTVLSTLQTPSNTGEIVTQIFRPEFVDVNNLVPVLRPLISPNNTVNVDVTTNTIVITDYSENLKRIGKIITQMDNPENSELDVIPIKNAVAADIASVVLRFLEGENNRHRRSVIDTTIVVEPRSNVLVLRSSNSERQKLARKLIEKLDNAAAPDSRTEGGWAENIHVVHLKNADAVRLAEKLRAIIQSNPTYIISKASQRGGAVNVLQQEADKANTGSKGSNNRGNTERVTTANSALSGAGSVSIGGQIQADPATNTLIITAPEPQYRQLLTIIQKLDERRAQVYVEALIAEVTTDRGLEFGFQWQFPIGQNGDNTVGVIGNNSKNPGAGVNIIDLAIKGTSITENPLGAGLNIGAGKLIDGRYVLSALARFLESTGDANILSTPNLMTLDNEEARIVIGQNVPFLTGQFTNSSGNENPFQTIERKDVGLTLRVKPQISQDGNIKMRIFQEVSSLQTNSAEGFITNKRTIETNVLVENGSIVILGGLLQDDYSTSEEKIPVLGNVPVVGNLFKSKKTSYKKTNLMIFLRPVVLRNATDTENFTLTRYDEMQVDISASRPEQKWLLRTNQQASTLSATEDISIPRPALQEDIQVAKDTPDTATANRSAWFRDDR